MGAGQGLNMSGAIADCAFINTCEKVFPLKAGSAARYGIQLYTRMKDDIFAIPRRDPERTLFRWHWVDTI